MKNPLWPIAAAALAAAPAGAADWVPLFDGKSLNGWVPKFTGYPLGENYRNTFRVEDGLLKVDYSGYSRFKGEFGHLFYKTPFKAYKLRLEYRFHGEQVPGGPKWAFRNNGVMVFSQAPGTMSLKQDFPVSVEFQLLGQTGTNKRPSGSVCTPGTNVVMDGKLITQHCTESSDETMLGDAWVKAEIDVLPGGHVCHYIAGKMVMAYDAPELDKRDPDARRLIEAGVPLLLTSGYIALQAESHPTDFRNIEILELPAT